jgi:acyl-CoA synthetase (AMP-forming)/AMP-acid ligase II
MLRLVPELPLDGRRVLRLDDAPASDEELERGPAIGRDLAMIIYTSGSTGMPKGIMLSHEGLVAGAQTVADYLDLSERDVLISLLPFTFDYGLNQLLTSLLVGGTLVVQRSMLPADICRTLARERVTGMAGVPLLWLQLAERWSPFLQTQLPDLRYMTNSGGTFPRRLIEPFRRAHPRASLYLMYGLTEAFRSTFLPPQEVETRPESIGRAIPNVEILVVDEQGRACAADQAGELVHRGAHVALGYWRDPEATARVFRPHPLQEAGCGAVETVVFSGDVVRRDAEGYLYFVGRRDQMIKSMGVRVSPEEVEHYLQASGLLSAVAVFAVPRDEQPAIVAAVQPSEPESFRVELLEAFCAREMPEYMRPAVIWSVSEMPRTSSGKPDRPRLKEAYLAS